MELTIVYTKNDLKEIRFRNEAAHESSVHDFMHEKIDAKPYHCIDSARNRCSSDIETVKICRYDEMNDYDKVNLYCNAFNKYMKCVKEIEPPFLSSILKGIEIKIDIGSILNKNKKKALKYRKQTMSSLLSQQRLRKLNEREMKRHTMKNL